MTTGRENGRSRLLSLRMNKALLSRLEVMASEVGVRPQTLLTLLLDWSLTEMAAGRGPSRADLLTAPIVTRGRPKGIKGKGEVYFVQEGGPTGLIKIGWSSNAAYRMAGLQVGRAAKLKLLLVVPGTQKSEAAAHEKFKAYRAHGEWFRPEPGLLRGIEQIRVAMAERATKAGGS